MELDKRIKEGKRPLNCFDTEQAMKFIGKQCYFSDDATDFIDLDKADGDSMFYIAELQNIWTAEEYCFADNSNDWRYILPVEFVNGQEKDQKSKINFEQYHLETFKKEFNIGDVVTFKGKSNTDRAGSYYECIYSGYRIFAEKGSTNIIINLGLWGFTFSELFDFYEIKRGENWEPFGRKVETINLGH